MTPQRYLCSELVTLKIGSAESWVNLEEIWPNGAVLEAEEPVPTHESAELRSGATVLAGTIVNVEEHEFGWRVEMAFSALTPWDPETFRPAHMLAV